MTDEKKKKGESNCSKCNKHIHFQDEPHWSAGECSDCWTPDDKMKKAFEDGWEVAKAIGCSVCGMAEFQTNGRCGLDPNHSMRICPARRNTGNRERAEAIRELRMRRAR